MADQIFEEMSRRLSKIKPKVSPEGTVKVTYVSIFDKKTDKYLQKNTIVSDLPDKFNVKVTKNYKILINGSYVDTDLKLASLCLPIEVKFEPILKIKCTLYTPEKLKGEKNNYDGGNINTLVRYFNNNSYHTLFFNSKGENLIINDQNFLQTLENDENYYLFQYPKKYEEMRISILSNPTNMKKSRYIDMIYKYLNTDLTNIQQLLCIIYKINISEELKSSFFNHIQTNSILPLVFTAKQFFNDTKHTIFCREYFLPFVLSLETILDGSKNYLQSFSKLFNKFGHSISPFSIVQLQTIFLREKSEENMIVEFEPGIYGVYKGEIEDDMNLSLFYDPITEKIVKFDFAYSIMKRCDEHNKINFEDIIFEASEYSR